MAALRKSSLIPCAHIRVVDTRLSFKPLLHADTVSMRWGNRIQGPETPALTSQRMESVLLLYLSGERAYPSLEGNFPGHTHRHPLLFTHEGSVEEWKKCCIARVTLVRYCWLDGGTNCGTSLGDAIILHTFSSIIPQRRLPVPRLLVVSFIAGSLTLVVMGQSLLPGCLSPCVEDAKEWML